MIGLGFESHGGPERIRFVEIPEPQPGPGEVRVRIRAASFNHLDLFTLAGIPGVEIDRPHVLGSDGAGVVDTLGEGVHDLETGAPVLLNPGLSDGTCDACRAGEESECRTYRILGEHTQGTAAPFVVLPRRNVHRIPPGLSLEQAAAAPLVLQTVWRAVGTIGALRPGERCAVIGSGGATAPSAVQMAHRLGAKVVVVARTGAKADRVRALGADEVLLVSEEQPMDRALWAWSEKRGIDVIFNSVGGATIAPCVRALARGGRLVVIGATTGPMVEIDLRTLFWRQASLRGSTMANRREFDRVLQALGDGSLTPIVDRVYAWSDGPSAIARLSEPDVFGKVVLTVP